MNYNIGLYFQWLLLSFWLGSNFINTHLKRNNLQNKALPRYIVFLLLNNRRAVCCKSRHGCRLQFYCLEKNSLSLSFETTYSAQRKVVAEDDGS